MSGSGPRLRAFVASTFLPEVTAEFSAHFEITQSISAGRPLDELQERSAGGDDFEILILSLDVGLDAAAIAALPTSVRVAATYSVGTDHIDLEAARARGLIVFNTPGVLADSVAENAMLLMLGAARRATESIDLIRSGEWPGWNPTQLVGVQLAGRTLGILGMGDIGERVATRAQAFGMNVRYCNRNQLPASHPFADGYCESPSALIRQSDVLLLLCPSTEATRGIIDASLLAQASADLLLVNVARGDIVVDDALIDALRSGRIRGAGLDVFAGEPRLDARYFDLPNVFMLPHVGSSTIEARLGMGRILIEAIEAWQAGRDPSNRVA